MTQNLDLFSQFKDSLIAIDPVAWSEKYLTLDGRPFRLNGNGYKPFADIYRYVGSKSLESTAKPVVIVKGRQVGATTMASVLELYFMCCGLFGKMGKPPIRVMHCFPQLELAYAYSKTKLNPMITGSVQLEASVPGKKTKSYVESKLDTASASNDSLQYKQFEGGNHIWIESTGINGDRIRGKSLDCCIFDEVQDCRAAALGNAVKVLAKCQYGPKKEGIQLYFGTPKQRGSAFWNLWQASSQQFYHLGCEQCKEYFPLYTPGNNDWETIWFEDDLPDDHPSHGYMVRCTHCSHEQDKREAAERGKWIALNKEDDVKMVGYHINQLYMPDFPRWKIISEKPENHPINTERAYQNEVLGEFFAGEASPITPEQIDTACADRERKFRSRISPNEDLRVFLGCDWGQKVDADLLTVGESKRTGGQSYSCAVVLVAQGPHILSIDFATRLKRNDLESKKAIVEQMFRQYSVTLAVGDIGYANDLTEILQQQYGDRFLASQAVNRVNGHYKYKSDYFPHTILFEKDYLYAEVFDMLKKGRIRFPYGDYEKIAWLIQHCCSMEIKPTMDRSGGIGMKYVKGSGVNDGWAALCNAYIAYRFLTTEAFSHNNDPNKIKDITNENKQIPAVLGYIPGMNPVRKK